MKKLLALLAIPAALAIGACGPPPAVGALVQRTACNSTAVAPDPARCVHWVNHNPAWNYPAETEWVGPWWNYDYDLSHGNGAELLP